MNIIRKFPLTAFAAMQCIVAGLATTSPARAAEPIPGYFFSQWTVRSNCTEANAGLAARVQPGLQFKISKEAVTSGSHYILQAIDTAGQQWASGWNGLVLEYRPGTRMTVVPADFECVAGSESSSASTSPFLAMSGYVQSAEPQYAEEHWYGLANIHGQLEHVLIFPRDVKGSNSAIVVLQSANTSSNLSLDDNGVINTD